MIESIEVDRILRHRVKGALYGRDLIEAAQRSGESVYPVLWDVRESVLVETDLTYGAFLHGIIKTQTQSRRKRVFLVESRSMAERLRRLLTVVERPWPWRICCSEDDALAWLSAQQ